MKREQSLLSYMDKEENMLGDDELLDKLSDEYLDATRKGDHGRIDETIAPRFWQRFGSYFHEYAREWKGAGGATSGDAYTAVSESLGQIQAGWMDQMLRGDIALAEEVDEEGTE
jgi:hypothetical protein